MSGEPPDEIPAELLLVRGLIAAGLGVALEGQTPAERRRFLQHFRQQLHEAIDRAVDATLAEQVTSLSPVPADPGPDGGGDAA